MYVRKITRQTEIHRQITNSPTNRTAVTDIAIATISFTNFPRKIGNASIAIAFDNWI